MENDFVPMTEENAPLALAEKPSKETFVWRGQKPWESFGKPIDNSMTTKEMLKAADLDWKVIREPTFYNAGNRQIRAPKDVLYRQGYPDTVFTEVPENWHITQNEEAFEVVERWVDEGKMRLLSAGSLKHGQIVWFMAEVGYGFDVFGGDEHRNNILFTLPHRYGKSIDIRQTPLRIACNNMIAFALRNNHNQDMVVKWDHRKRFDPEEVRIALSIADAQFDTLRVIAQELGSKTFGTDDLEEYLGELYPIIRKEENKPNSKKFSRKSQMILQYLDEQPGADYAYGTWWQVFQAVTFCANHVFGLSPETRLISSWYGAEGDQCIRALQLARKYAAR